MTFQREDRYIVIKRKDLKDCEYVSLVSRFLHLSADLHRLIFRNGRPARRYLVIESDWPEYEPAWAMIEARVAGKQVEPAGWLDPATGDFLTTEGRANTLAMGHGIRLERYSVALYAAQSAPTVLPPDDQDEINRLHAEFIAVDEPNNEQVMAFQDASYALGLKRGQAHEAALQQRLTETDQRLDELISAVRSLNRGKAHEIRLGSDDQPVYWQRKEWIDWLLDLCDQASSVRSPAACSPTPLRKS